MFVSHDGQQAPHLSGEQGLIIDEGGSLSLSEWSRTTDRPNQQRRTTAREGKKDDHEGQMKE